VKNPHVAAIMLAGSLCLSAAVIATAAPAPTAPTAPAAPAAPAVKGAPAASSATAAPGARPGLTILEFKPAMDDLMTMLIQPRHIKLWYAGQAKNWILAGFELNELRDALGRVGQTIPKYRNFSVDATVSSIFVDKMKAVDAAIRSQNPMQFNAAYADMTEACNTCHQGMEHPFLVIKVPDAAFYPDQVFTPVAAPK
jgi:hypothetical protein